MAIHDEFPTATRDRELMMATILKFELRDLPEPSMHEESGPAEIVIFPGVRIERDDFSLSDRLDGPAKSNGNARHRGTKRTIK